MACTEATPDYSKGTDTATIEAGQDDPIQHTKDTTAGPAMTHHTSCCKSSTCHSSLGYHSWDHIWSQSQPTYWSMKYSSHQKGSCSSGSYSNQGNWKSHLRRSEKVQVGDPPSEYYSLDDDSIDFRRRIRFFKLVELSPSSDSHEQGGQPSNKLVRMALITDCPTITVHVGKCYKALINSGAAISLVRCSMYQTTDNSLKQLYRWPWYN